jgi:CelD/BcsL family acetyltransferase involved in cellulose biosynthesis
MQRLFQALELRACAARCAAGTIPSMLSAELITDVASLEEIAPAWDALAVSNGQPMSSPAWLLGWLRHLAPSGAGARVVTVHDGDQLVAVAPFFVDIKRSGRVDYRLMGNALPRAGPVVLPGLATAAATAICRALAAASPPADLVAFECLSLASQWPLAFREQWPGGRRPPLHRYFTQGAPVVSLQEESFDTWLASRSSRFRSDLRRRRRRFAEAGGTFRISGRETLAADLAAFIRLHSERWRGRGKSSIVAAGERMPAMLEEIGSAHLDEGRFRLCLLEIDGEPISADLYAAAGGEVISINIGWDERFTGFGAFTLSPLYALQDAWRRGDRRLDLAPGMQPHKLRLANGNDPVAWSILMIPTPRLPLTYGRTVPMLTRMAAREQAKRVLPDRGVERLRRLRRQMKGARSGPLEPRDKATTRSG